MYLLNPLCKVSAKDSCFFFLQFLFLYHESSHYLWNDDMKGMEFIVNSAFCSQSYVQIEYFILSSILRLHLQKSQGPIEGR